MTQAEFQSQPNASQSQAAAILAILEKTLGEWVPLPTLSRESGSLAVATRVSNLRAKGYVIDQKNERDPSSKAIHSFYRYSGEVTHG